ncbi:MAG: hypothetical protein LBH30_01475 [Prevotellaceae bacterium]|nr:hypothetical protein [Prevotellaceae bacterium]
MMKKTTTERHCGFASCFASLAVRNDVMRLLTDSHPRLILSYTRVINLLILEKTKEACSAIMNKPHNVQ